LQAASVTRVRHPFDQTGGTLCRHSK
jgi:hypothetical protein